ncbi:hypothetical protein TWF696_006452 [Orbilia brochopaga]|uniref:Uncharacterized protein n=1 Tax=Orbilia brochopaga TaxID=3140254 RepID=A0AAV9V2S8_9PEZI
MARKAISMANFSSKNLTFLLPPLPPLPVLASLSSPSWSSTTGFLLGGVGFGFSSVFSLSPASEVRLNGTKTGKASAGR